MLKRSAYAAAALALAALGCGSRSESLLGPLPAGGRHVLFIGNSLTYYNQLPTTVSQLAALSGDTVRVAQLAHPDFALVDHLATGEAQTILQREKWDVVVLQQGPSSLDASRVLLNEGVDKLAPMIRAAGGRPALFEVWPTVDRAADVPRVRESYRLAAERVGGLFLPAGTAWQEAWARDASLRLYEVDGLHPSAVGSFLSALVMVEQLTGRDVRALPAKAYAEGKEFSLPAATIRLLQDAAHAANARGSAP